MSCFLFLVKTKENERIDNFRKEAHEVYVRAAERIAKRVPVIAQKSTQEEPQKPKRMGFLSIFGKKEKPKPTTTTTMLYTLNRDMIAQQQAQSRQLSSMSCAHR